MTKNYNADKENKLRILKLIVIAAIVITLGGCASGVTRDPAIASSAPSAAKIPAAKIASVKVYLNDNAQKLHADNIKFNPESLRGMLQRTLEVRNLIASDALNRMEVEITEIRTRSNFAAIAFGFLAGSDSVKGNVHILAPDGKTLNKYEVSASYALGGLGGGQDEARMSWLYEEFSKLAIKEFAGDNAKK